MINPELKVGMYVLLGTPGTVRNGKSGLAVKSYYHHGEIVAIEPERFRVSLFPYKGSNFKLGQFIWFNKNEANYRIKR